VRRVSASQNIVPRAEFTLIVVMCAGFALIAQTFSFRLFQLGLLAVMGATLLNIAVGNLPRQAGAGRALLLTLAILGLVAVVFGAGILLVPTLTQLAA
jgi:hypothetical protein